MREKRSVRDRSKSAPSHVRLTVLQSIGEHAKSQGLSCGEGGFPCRAVDHDSREVGDIRDPAAIDFPFELDA